MNYKGTPAIERCPGFLYQQNFQTIEKQRGFNCEINEKDVKYNKKY